MFLADGVNETPHCFRQSKAVPAANGTGGHTSGAPVSDDLANVLSRLLLAVRGVAAVKLIIPVEKVERATRPDSRQDVICDERRIVESGSNNSGVGVRHHLMAPQLGEA